mmetsp:Transcript_4997/g.18210  ORF Transcript_4997/g.18210 Transcript_4997/m.18210 type:complete len:652 (-) Transcript_4997:1402-3357(-)
MSPPCSSTTSASASTARSAAMSRSTASARAGSRCLPARRWTARAGRCASSSRAWSRPSTAEAGPPAPGRRRPAGPPSRYAVRAWPTRPALTPPSGLPPRPSRGRSPLRRGPARPATPAPQPASIRTRLRDASCPTGCGSGRRAAPVRQPRAPACRPAGGERSGARPAPSARCRSAPAGPRRPATSRSCRPPGLQRQGQPAFRPQRDRQPRLGGGCIAGLELESLQQQRGNQRHLQHREVLAQADARALAEGQVGAARHLRRAGHEALRPVGLGLGPPARVAVQQIGRDAQHHARIQLQLATLPGQGDAAAESARHQRRRRRVQAHRLLQAGAQPGQGGSVIGGRQTVADDRAHLGRRARLRLGVAGDQPAPPQQRRRRRLVAGLEDGHALVEDSLLAEHRAVMFIAQRTQPGQQVGAVRPRRGVQLLLQKTEQAAQAAPLLGLARQRQPVRQRHRPEHLAKADLAEVLGRGGHRRCLVARLGAEQHAQDHVHRDVAEQARHLHRPGLDAVEPGAAGVHHEGGIPGHALVRKGRHQQPALAVPDRALRHQHRLSQGLAEHLGAAFPADQRVRMLQHQPAQQLGVEHVDDALAQDALAHHVAIGLLARQRGEVVARHLAQRGQAPGAGGGAGEVVPGQACHGGHGAPPGPPRS